MPRLTPAQAIFYFLSGYTAKVVGTERSVTDPEATFSSCFGAPFMVHPPSVYGRMLGERIARHQVKVWVVNTGWSGGAYGVGHRIKIAHTRAIIHAVLDGALDHVGENVDPYFRLDVPISCPDAPTEILDPRNTWSDKDAYDAQARRLAGMFSEHFRSFEEQVDSEVREAGPNVS